LLGDASRLENDEHHSWLVKKMVNTLVLMVKTMVLMVKPWF
jgi:hypothetical protein